jgi:hypothetical protein
MKHILLGRVTNLPKQPLRVFKTIGAITINWLKKILSHKCNNCETGMVHHSHSEPFGWTTIEVYECDKCHHKYA